MTRPVVYALSATELPTGAYVRLGRDLNPRLVLQKGNKELLFGSTLKPHPARMVAEIFWLGGPCGGRCTKPSVRVGIVKGETQGYPLAVEDVGLLYESQAGMYGPG